MTSGKDFFLERYRKLGQKFSPQAVKLSKTIRVNPLVKPEKEVLERLQAIGVKLKRIPYVKHGYAAESRFSLGAITEHLLGFYYLQDPSSQFAVEVLDPKPGELVLDMAAAPGGKTTYCSQLMNNEGTVVALEMKNHRLPSLMMNLERMQSNNVLAYFLDAREVSKLGLKFDKILLDAPCSGNFATDKDWFEKRDIHGIKKSAEIQRKLLSVAVSMLKQNGVLVYSTCSLEPEENELNIQWLLEQHNVELEHIECSVASRALTGVFVKKLYSSISRCLRFWPHRTNTQGFFIAKVKLK